MATQNQLEFVAEKKQLLFQDVSLNWKNVFGTLFSGGKFLAAGGTSFWDGANVLKSFLGIAKVKKDLAHQAADALLTAYFQTLQIALADTRVNLSGNAFQKDPDYQPEISSFDIADLGQGYLDDTAFFKTLTAQLEKFLKEYKIQPGPISQIKKYMMDDFSYHLKYLLAFSGKKYPEFRQFYNDIQIQRDSWEKEEDIKVFRNEMVDQFSGKSVLEGVSLKDIFIIPRCMARIRHSKSHWEEVEDPQCLEQTVLSLLETDRPVVVQGEPGHGKTSFARYLAHKLASERDHNWFPVLGEFKSLKLEKGISGLSAAAEEYLPEDLPRHKRVLFILDGLDEILGTARKPEEYKTFIQDLLKKIALYQKNHAGGNVLITSRTQYMQTHPDSIPADVPHHELTIRNFDKKQIETWLKKYKKFRPDSTVTCDTLRKLKLLKDQPEAKDEEKKPGDRKAHDFIGLPVILALVVDTLLSPDNKESTTDLSGMLNQFQIYERIIQHIYKREVEKNLPKERFPFREEDTFFRFLERIACILFRKKTQRLDIRTLKESWSDYKKISGLPDSDFWDKEGEKSRLFFYFKSEPQQDSGQAALEFMHKSFLDFLMARALVREMKRLHQKFLVEDEDDRPTHADTAYILMKIAAWQPLDSNTLGFYIDGIQAAVGAKGAAWKNLSDHLIQVFHEANEHHFLSDARTQGWFGKDLYESSVHGLSCLYTVAVILRKILSIEEIIHLWSPVPDGERSDAFHCFISYLNSLGENNRKSYFIDLNGMDFSRQVFSSLDLSGLDFSFCKFSDTEFHQVNLYNANLSGTDLSGAKLLIANLSGANLSGANLNGANLFRSYFYKADLSGADLSGADLFEADLSGADLSEADLSGAELLDTHLQGANLYNANLSGADLNEADLFEANLSGADLRGAMHLIKEQIEAAITDETTRLPDDMQDLLSQ